MTLVLYIIINLTIGGINARLLLAISQNKRKYNKFIIGCLDLFHAKHMVFIC